ncbi:LytR/AlgR family response regulator transcription factor [Dyadobacter sandarakinus]|uniref:Response regulator transcription factor n=1 Tax=Dyadobacter sandarakinus TaxID=2747268 RepID=A0ABX7I7F9_9BACT|nr:LytTR family DNA-binding domain-containing protein [Dyadobacter sandarakinus]QRR02042.1 response regulator transcription factor [Dyadobacter sandarakinus]
MKILLIEDEKPAARRLAQLIKEKEPAAEILPALDTISAAAAWFAQNLPPDLVFLDIQLADGISFEIFEKVKVDAPVIFCTAYDQYAIRAFKHNSIDYLLKPVDPAELGHALDKFKAGRREPALSLDQLRDLLYAPVKSYKERFLVKMGERILTIETRDIAFFYSEDKVTLLQTSQGRKFTVDFTLDEIENMVAPERFFRLNRKYISAIQAIKDVFTYSNSRLKVILHDCPDQDILISREKMGSFKSWLGG